MESQTSELKARGCICLCYCGRRRRASFTTAIVGSFHITSSNSFQTTELSILLKIYFDDVLEHLKGVPQVAA